jgi:hypothetical protein
MGNQQGEYVQRFRRTTILLFVGVLVFCCLCHRASTASPSQSVELLDVGKINSFQEMEGALELLRKFTAEAVKENRLTFHLQEIILKRSEECIDRLLALHGKAAPGADPAKEQEKALFSANRLILQQILVFNKKVLVDFQENKLDQIEDPLAFFKSPQWQEPQHLVVESSYWLGWNGFYSSLLYGEEDGMRKSLLEEAVESFSRAFVDAREDSRVIASLFGRGLCYRQLNKYQDAMKDFVSVRNGVDKDDLLYLRCQYEEAVISYRTGKGELALRSLDEIDRGWAQRKVPDEVRKDLNRLRASIIRDLPGKQGGGTAGP